MNLFFYVFALVFWELAAFFTFVFWLTESLAPKSPFLSEGSGQSKLEVFQSYFFLFFPLRLASSGTLGKYSAGHNSGMLECAHIHTADPKAPSLPSFRRQRKGCVSAGVAMQPGSTDAHDTGGLQAHCYCSTIRHRELTAQAQDPSFSLPPPFLFPRAGKGGENSVELSQSEMLNFGTAPWSQYGDCISNNQLK